MELPPAEMGRLEEIAQLLLRVPPMQREHVAQQLMAPGYQRALLDLFRVRSAREELPVCGRRGCARDLQLSGNEHTGGCMGCIVDRMACIACWLRLHASSHANVRKRVPLDCSLCGNRARLLPPPRILLSNLPRLQPRSKPRTWRTHPA